MLQLYNFGTGVARPEVTSVKRGWYSIAEQPAPAPHLAHPEGCAALRIVLVDVPRVSRSCEHFQAASTGVPRL